jgi:cysteine desulfurase / selenocysteine lyase
MTETETLHTETIRRAFPALHQQVNGHPLVYLDNAATTQKPQSVIRAIAGYYEHDNANIHRGIHTLAERATQAFEQTRETVRSFLNAPSADEIIFVRGVTEAINLVAASYGGAFIEEGDDIIVSGLEHHANLVPWQWICRAKKARLLVIPITDSGELLLDEFKRMLTPRTKLVALNHASNSLGTINSVKEITGLAHQCGAVVLIDGAQAGAHLPIDVQAIGCDFYCLSAHKMYGPTGVGILYGKRNLLEQMPPYQGGGEMIREVTYSSSTYNTLPYKFEAGTPNIADVIAFQQALNFILETGMESIVWHERELLHYATKCLTELPLLTLVGTAAEKVGVVSFVLKGIHPLDVGQMLDARGIAVRTGHHCTQPLMHRLGIDGTVRVSLAIYNTRREIDQLVQALWNIIHFLQ